MLWFAAVCTNGRWTYPLRRVCDTFELVEHFIVEPNRLWRMKYGIVDDVDQFEEGVLVHLNSILLAHARVYARNLSELQLLCSKRPGQFGYLYHGKVEAKANKTRTHTQHMEWVQSSHDSIFAGREKAAGGGRSGTGTARGTVTYLGHHA